MLTRLLPSFIQFQRFISHSSVVQMTDKQWYPNAYINPNQQQDEPGNFALIILNRPIKLDPNLMVNLWNKASVRVVVDGGANCWLKFKETFCQNIMVKSPDLLTGDFDSITEETRQIMAKQNVKEIQTNDQNETDFTKALLELQKNYLHDKSIGSVIVLLDTSGRIDHLLSHINTLFKANSFMPNVQIFILCKSSISWLLDAGQHTIHIPQNLVKRQQWCAYVPIGQKCLVTTKGLKWDLENKTVQFGGIVSTSNTYTNEVVYLKTDGFLYWSMGLEGADND